MQLVRKISPRWWLRGNQKFDLIAFKASTSDKGVSSVSLPCILDCSADICAHLRRYYLSEKSVGEPLVYWIYSLDRVREVAGITSEIEVSEEESTTGDICHRSVLNIEKRHSKKVAGSIRPEDCYFCDSGTVRPCTASDFNAWKSQLGPA